MTREKVQQFVDQLADRLCRSVAVDDRDRHFVTCSRHFGDLDSLRVNVLVSRHLDDTSSAYLYSFVDAENLKGPIRVPENADLGITVRRCYPVWKNNEWVGYLWLIGEATAADDGIIAQALPELALILSRGRGISAQQEAATWAAFAEVLSEPNRRRELPNFWQNELIDPQTNIAVVVAYAPAESDRRYPLAKELEGLIARSLKDRQITRAASLPRGRLAMTVIRDQSPRRSPQVTLTSILQHPSDGPGPGRLSVGVSNWGPITQSGELLRQSTLAAYAAFDRRKSQLGWSECSYQGVLLCAAAEDPDAVIPKPVMELSKTSTGAALLETARVFLEESGDISKASLRLNIHRTTLYYRMSRIEELTGYDLKNGHDRLALQIGVSLLVFVDSQLPLFLRSEEKQP